MTNVISPAEMQALHESFSVSEGGAPLVTIAVFPSASELDSTRTVALTEITMRWIGMVARNLSDHLRVPCTPRRPLVQSIARSLLPLANEESFWGVVEAYPGHRILLSLPRAFAVAICERAFGAAMGLGEERALAPTESILVGKLVRTWLALFSRLQEDFIVSLGRTSDSEEAVGDADWIRITFGLACSATEGTINVTMPSLTVRLLLGEIAAVERDHLAAASVVGRRGQVPVELQAVLGQTEIALNDLSCLRVGDVIALDRGSHDPVDVIIDERLCFQAKAGAFGERCAVELISAHGTDHP